LKHPHDKVTPDAVTKSWINVLPECARAYARLARFDRPAGSWLLFWPCAWGLALAGGLPGQWHLLLWFGLGTLAMRGAGCVYNDIIDRDLDAKVARTKDRPVANGRVSVRGASIWLVALALVGLLVLWQLRGVAQATALASLILVAVYPFMKRITWWPQAWLGLTFNWGALVGWLAVADPGLPMLLLYGAGIFWTLGYDTIYALQDIDDDALAGIKSSARVLGSRVRWAVSGFYIAMLILLGAALWQVVPDQLTLLSLLPLAGHLLWQVGQLDQTCPARTLMLFRSNRMAGATVFAACVVVGWR
jgi:4-hydroxybenzoate polyprenyltransferase